MTFVYPFPLIPMTSFLFPWLCVPILSSSHSHSQPREIVDYIPILIYSWKIIPIPSHSHSHRNKKSLKKLLSVHGEEWFSLEWAHKIIHYYSTLVSHSRHQWSENDMLGWRSGQRKIKMAVLTQCMYYWTESLMIRWKAAMEIHSHSIALFPFPYFYSHSHSHDIVIITSIPMGIPWDPNCSNL